MESPYGIYDSVFQTARNEFFLFGPRGTGKSMWTRACFPDAERVDLLQPDSFRQFSARPERLREVVEALRGRKQSRSFFKSCMV